VIWQCFIYETLQTIQKQPTNDKQYKHLENFKILSNIQIINANGTQKSQFTEKQKYGTYTQISQQKIYNYFKHTKGLTWQHNME